MAQQTIIQAKNIHITLYRIWPIVQTPGNPLNQLIALIILPYVIPYIYSCKDFWVTAHIKKHGEVQSLVAAHA